MAQIYLPPKSQFKKFIFTSIISSIICVALAILLPILMNSNNATGAESLFSFKNGLVLIPFLILASWVGTIPASISVAVCFITFSLFDFRIAYLFFNMFVGVQFCILPVQFHWYKSFPKTLIFAFCFSIVLLISTMLLRFLLFPLDNLLEFLLSDFLNLLLISGIVFIANYLFFNFLPKKFRKYFFNIAMFEYPEFFMNTSKSQMGKQMLFILVLEAITLIFVAMLFAEALFREEARLLPVFDVLRYRSSRMFFIKLSISLLIVSLPIIMVANFFAQLKITAPIRLMASAMDDFTDDTVYSQKKMVTDIHLLPIHSKGELKTLHIALKKTAYAVTGYIAHMEEEQKLREDLRVAQEANKAKSAFLSNMSHEIRTPINAVLGLDEMILRESAEPQTLKYAQDIQSSGKSLLSLINDILDFSKIEAGKMEIIPVEYDLSSVINDLVNMIQPRVSEKNLKLNVNVDPAVPHFLRGDEIRIKQCVLNILTNAAKYTKVGSVSLTVSFSKKTENSILLTFSVTDTGIGIKEEDIPKLFTAFERIEEKRNRTIEGTGLGLNIVQQLLALMGSRLEVQSVYGKGSTFFFTIEQPVLDWEKIGNYTNVGASAQHQYKEKFHAPDAKILVVDDTPLNLTVFCGLLKETKIQIETANGGREALSKMAKTHYDVIFLDHRMPDLDGIETFRELKKMTDCPNAKTPCIALTANAISGAKEMYMAEGFQGYLTKPIDSAKLESTLVKFLPKELVSIVEEKVQAKSETQKINYNIEGIDLNVGLSNCGGEDLYKKVVLDYYNAIEKKAQQIADFCKNGDFSNYTILVHALKSSSRMIGAIELSSLAEYLESCGDAKNVNEIQLKTPALLDLYKSYLKKLKPLLPQKKAQAKSQLKLEDYLKTLQELKNCVEVFDFDTADSILEMLESYQIPKEEQERFDRIKAAESAVDHDTLLNLL